MTANRGVTSWIPWIEHTEVDMADHVRCSFELAEAFDADVSMLLDDAGDPGLRTLETMAVEALRRGWTGRALAHHCRAMQLYPDPYFERLTALLRAAEVSVVSDPHTGPLHARVSERLLRRRAGIRSLARQHLTIRRSNLAEVAFLGCHLLWMMDGVGQQRLYDAVTVNAARAVGLTDHSIAPGNPANLVVHRHGSLTDILRFHEAPAAVISHGRVVDRDRMAELAGVASA